MVVLENPSRAPDFEILNHATFKVIETAFHPHSDTQFDLQQVALTMSMHVFNIWLMHHKGLI